MLRYATVACRNSGGADSCQLNMALVKFHPAASFILALRIRTHKLTRQSSPLVQQLIPIFHQSKDTNRAEKREMHTIALFV